MIPKGTKIPTKVGDDEPRLCVYEGAGYSKTGVYRPAPNCRMLTLDV